MQNSKKHCGKIVQSGMKLNTSHVHFYAEKYLIKNTYQQCREHILLRNVNKQTKDKGINVFILDEAVTQRQVACHLRSQRSVQRAGAASFMVI